MDKTLCAKPGETKQIYMILNLVDLGSKFAYAFLIEGKTG